MAKTWCERCANTGRVQAGRARGKRCKAPGCTVFADWLARNNAVNTGFQPGSRLRSKDGRRYLVKSDGALKRLEAASSAVAINEMPQKTQEVAREAPQANP